MAFTADEEAGGAANGVSWLLATHRELIDAQTVINPDGGEAGMKQGRKLYVAVQTSEKNFLTFGVETTDKGGHSSRPTADNPIYRLAAALTRLSQYGVASFLLPKVTLETPTISREFLPRRA